jgi:prepilin-type N-terminal cleavage/methylation domain-containing protein
VGSDVRDVRHRGGSEAGLTLVEMLVAMVIVGIVFAGAASALMNFSVASKNSERRVQATALMTEVHEQLQALPWDDAVLHEEELGPLGEIGLLATDAEGYDTFDGERLVTIPGGCPDVVTDDCRRIGTPLVEGWGDDAPVRIDGHEYEIYRAITEVTGRGDPDDPAQFADELRRFTVVVRWQLLGRWYEARLDSERAATATDLHTGPREVVAFDVLPSSIELAEDGVDPDVQWLNAARFRLDAVFPTADVGTVSSVRAVLPTAQGPEEVDLAKVTIAPRVYRLVIDPGTYAFTPDATQEIELKWLADSQPRETSVSVTFTAPPASPTPPMTGVVSTASLSTNVLEVGRTFPTDHRLCNSLTIYADVNGLQVTDSVVARFNPADSASRTLEGNLTGGAGNVSFTFAAGTPSPWRPQSGESIVDTFRISIVNEDGTRESVVVDSPQLTVSNAADPNGNCT